MRYNSSRGDLCVWNFLHRVHMAMPIKKDGGRYFKIFESMPRGEGYLLVSVKLVPFRNPRAFELTLRMGVRQEFM